MHFLRRHGLKESGDPRPEAIHRMSVEGVFLFPGAGPEEELHGQAPRAGGPACLTDFPLRKEGFFLRGEGPLVVAVPSCGSVLDVFHEWAEKGRPRVFDSVFAPEQTAGRGQLRREWFSPPGNLHAALYLPPSPSGYRDAASVAAGLGVVLALKGVADGLMLKWPNDIVQDGCKVGGVLLEERRGCLVAGIGLNTAHAPNACGLRTGAALPAARLRTVIPRPEALALWRLLVHRLRFWYENRLNSDTLSTFMTRAEERLLWNGENVLVDDGATPPYVARISGLAHDGGLFVVREGKKDILHTGSVSAPAEATRRD